jgi:hypothetical protein
MTGLGVTVGSINTSLNQRDRSAEEIWVERCLALASLPEDASAEQLTEGVRHVRGVSMSDDDPKDPTFGGRRVRELLREVIANYPRKRRLTAPPPEGPLEDIVINGEMRVDAQGRVVMLIEMLVGSDQAVRTLLPIFLDDSQLGIGKLLRRCELKTCNLLFISRAARLGGPRRKYCCDEHREKADRQDAPNRVARMRSASKRARAAAHK